MDYRDIRRMKRNAKRLFKRGDTIGRLCEQVANGGSPLQIAKDWDVLYSEMVGWIYKDNSRKQRYEGALVARSEWMVQRVLDELRSLALIDLREAFDETGKLKPLKEMPESVARAMSSIQTIEIGSGGITRKVKFNDKTKALELLGKNLKMFVDQVEIKGDINFDEARKRAQARVAAARGETPAEPPSVVPPETSSEG